jgi:hypothetical protein
VEAQAKRDAKKAPVQKCKRESKRKGSAPVLAKAKMMRRNEAEVAGCEIIAMGFEN